MEHLVFVLTLCVHFNMVSEQLNLRNHLKNTNKIKNAYRIGVTEEREIRKEITFDKEKGQEINTEP